MSTKRIVSFLSGMLALSLVVGTWAYYTATNVIDNQLMTGHYGNELVEKFTPDQNWQPGEKVDKEVWVENTGNYDLFVRVKMSEKWDIPDTGGTPRVELDSSNPKFLTATASTATQVDPLDGKTAGDDSVVYKELADANRPGDIITKHWTYNPNDGYWYYNEPLKALDDPGLMTPHKTESLLKSVTLAGDTDMGKYTMRNYYTSATGTLPSFDLVYTIEDQNNYTDLNAHPNYYWFEYDVRLPVPEGATHTRSISERDLLDTGYSGKFYDLIITSEVLQATQEAFDATPAWRDNTPANVKAAWQIN